VKAIVFDFIGTLANINGYSMEKSIKKLYEAIKREGFDVRESDFLEAYDEANEKYHAIRHEKLVEITNAVWISEALNALGFQTTPHDARIKTALNMFFDDYVKASELRPCVNELLEKAFTVYRLGLISNFTYAPVIYNGLRKLDINRFLNAVVVSDAVGWRKPHKKIFEEALRRLDVVPVETVYVGDSPLEDIKGAQALGMRTIFVPSQFYSLEFLSESRQKPDLIVEDVCELSHSFPECLNCI
jgi:putative hydrolase of the HAD superfamily